MTDKLIQLLNYYKREQRTLARQLREALQERDYKIAARIQEGQYLVAQQLGLLQNLHNPYTDELERLSRQIHFLQKHIAKTPVAADGYSEMLEQFEKRRQQLEQILPAPQTITTVLRECTEQVLAGQLDGFYLTLSKSARLGVSIRRVRRTAILTMSEVVRHRAEYNLRKQQVRQLRNIGFAYYDNKDKLLAVVPLANPHDVERIMQIWLRITCVVFSPQEFRNDSEIRYRVA